MKLVLTLVLDIAACWGNSWSPNLGHWCSTLVPRFPYADRRAPNFLPLSLGGWPGQLRRGRARGSWGGTQRFSIYCLFVWVILCFLFLPFFLCLFVFLCVCLFVCVCLSVCLSVCLYVCLSVCLYVHFLFVCVCACLFVCLFMWLFVCVLVS